MVVIILGNDNCISLSWHTHFSSVGFRGSLGMESYMGKYSICWYIKSLIQDGLSTMEKNLTEFKRPLMRPWKCFWSWYHLCLISSAGLLCVLLETFIFKYLLFMKSWILHSQIWFVRIFRNNFCSLGLISNAQGIKISLHFLAECNKQWSLLFWPSWHLTQLTWILVLAVMNSMLEEF